MSSVRLLFSTTKLPLSIAIRSATWSRWSHVALVDGDSVIEAVAWHGVRRAPLADAIARSSDFAIAELTAHDPRAVVAAADTQIGKPYDYTALVGLALHRDWQADEAWFCSELVAWAFDVTGQALLRPEFKRRVYPQHLWMLPAATQYTVPSGV